MRNSPRLVAYWAVLTSTSSTRVLLIELDIQCEDVNRGLTAEPQRATVGVVRDGLPDLVGADAACLGPPVHLQIGIGDRDIGVQTAAAGSDGIRRHLRGSRGRTTD